MNSSVRNQSPARLAASQQKVNRGAAQLHHIHTIRMCPLLNVSICPMHHTGGVEHSASSRALCQLAMVLLHQEKATVDI